MGAKFLREIAGLSLPAGPAEAALITQAEVANLPDNVRRYLHFMGVVGRPRVWSFRARQLGTFRMRPDRAWMACEAWQYNSRLGITRIFHMRVRFSGVVPVYVRDTYIDGHGRMQGRVLDRFSVVDVADAKIDIGELVTYLNDAILFAPSMLLGPETTWTTVDDNSFDVSLSDHGLTVSARVFLDKWGAPVNFSTTDRFGEDPERPGNMVRTRWSTPIRGFTLMAGRPVPTGGQAIWHFPSGDFTYADFALAPNGLTFDVAPGVPTLD